MGFGIHKYLRASMDNPDNQYFPFSTLTGQSSDVPDEEEEKEDVKKELSTKLVVQCANVSQLSLLYSELQDRGFICELKE